MGPALDYHPDGSPEPRSPRTDSASCFTDALGDRFLEFDLASGTSVERLRFAKEFAESTVFENAVRDRIERFEYFRHPAITTVRSIVRQPGGALVLESKYTAGRRLSEIGLERNAALALDVIRQLTPALVALHEAGDGIVHGLFGPERVVVTREGRLMLVEHVLGGAMVSMRMPSHRMRADFGLALPDNQDVIALDQEDDLTELGLLALSLLVGRRVTPAEYPDQIEALVSESAKSAADLTAEAAWVRRWIERAVHVGPNPFRTAREAVDTIGELGEKGELRPVGRAPVARPGPVLVAGSAAAERFAALQRDLPDDTAATHHDAPASTSPDFVQTMPIAMTTAATTSAGPTPPPGTNSMRTPTPAKGTARKPIVAAAEPPRRAPAPPTPAKDHTPPRTVVTKTKKRWLMPTLISLAAAQALIIGGLMIVKQSQTSASDTPAGAPVQSAAQVQTTPAVQLSPAPAVTTLPPAPLASHTPAGQTPASTPSQPPASGTAETSHPSTSAPAPAAAPSTPAATSGDAAASSAGGQRIGGIKVTAPFELQVFENGKLLGVTAGSIALVEGPHALDLVNDSLEFKQHANMTVKPGQITALTITVPQGRLSVNAVPWAEVLIDGNDMGQTPLANLAVAIGQHEVTFHHPTLGDQKQTVVVKATTPTRISVTFPK